MSTWLHDLSHADLFQAAVPAARTTNFTGTAIDMLTSEGQVTLIQSVGAVSGTSPTLDGKLQESADGSTGWADLILLDQVTAADNIQKKSARRSKRYVRYVGTIAGTSPSFTFGAEVLSQKKQVND